MASTPDAPTDRPGDSAIASPASSPASELVSVLEARLAALECRLEARSRLQRRLNAGLLATVGLGAMFGAGSMLQDARFDSVTCRQLSVVDSEGKVRMLCDAREDGTAGLRWNDREGTTRMTAFTDKTGLGGIVWCDMKGTNRIIAGTMADGTAGMAVLDPASEARIDISVTGQGVSNIGQIDPPDVSPYTMPLEQLRAEVERLRAIYEPMEAAYRTKMAYLNQVAGPAGAMGLQYEGETPSMDLRLQAEYLSLSRIYRERLQREAAAAPAGATEGEAGRDAGSGGN